MSPSEAFRKFAGECRTMAKFARFPESKATWDHLVRDQGVGEAAEQISLGTSCREGEATAKIDLVTGRANAESISAKKFLGTNVWVPTLTYLFR
jgi:hypothetical protein